MIGLTSGRKSSFLTTSSQILISRQSHVSIHLSSSITENWCSVIIFRPDNVELVCEIHNHAWLKTFSKNTPWPVSPYFSLDYFKSMPASCHYFFFLPVAFIKKKQYFIHRPDHYARISHRIAFLSTVEGSIGKVLVISIGIERNAYHRTVRHRPDDSFYRTFYEHYFSRIKTKK